MYSEAEATSCLAMERAEVTSALARPNRFGSYGSSDGLGSGGSSIQGSLERYVPRGRKKSKAASKEKAYKPNKAATRKKAYESKGAFNTNKARLLFDDSDDEIN